MKKFNGHGASVTKVHEFDGHVRKLLTGMFTINCRKS